MHMLANHVSVSGSLTHDPELLLLESGLHKLPIVMRDTEQFFDRTSGQWEERTILVDCELYGDEAVTAASELSKGAEFVIEGRIKGVTQGEEPSVSIEAEAIGFTQRPEEWPDPAAPDAWSHVDD